MLTARSIAPRTMLRGAALATTLLTAAAAHAQFGTLPGQNALGQGVRFSNVAMGDASNMDRPGLYRFYDEATLRNHWTRYGLRGQFPPKIDWFNDQVVIIALGRRATGGYSVSIGGMEKLATGRVKITAVETTPFKNQQTTQQLTAPYLAIAIDRTIPAFDVAWTQTTPGGLGSVPNGSTVIISPGNVTIVNPLIGPCAMWGGDYFSDCSVPGEFWIGDNQDLWNYNRRYLGDPRAILPAFDWNSERLLAVHLGARAEAVAIETISFERKGDRGILWLAEAPPRGFRKGTGRPISPFALMRVSREVRSVEVHWAKKDGSQGDSPGR